MSNKILGFITSRLFKTSDTQSAQGIDSNSGRSVTSRGDNFVTNIKDHLGEIFTLGTGKSNRTRTVSEGNTATRRNTTRGAASGGIKQHSGGTNATRDSYIQTKLLEKYQKLTPQERNYQYGLKLLVLGEKEKFQTWAKQYPKALNFLVQHTYTQDRKPGHRTGIEVTHEIRESILKANSNVNRPDTVKKPIEMLSDEEVDKMVPNEKVERELNALEEEIELEIELEKELDELEKQVKLESAKRK